MIIFARNVFCDNSYHKNKIIRQTKEYWAWICNICFISMFFLLRTFFQTDICYTKIIIKPQKYYLNIHLSLALKIYEIFFVDIKMFFNPNWWQYLYVKNENIATAMLDNIVNPTITSTVGILFCIFQWTRWYPALNCKNIFFINFIYIYFFPSFSVHRL